MEYGTIERELHIAATPDVVYQVISSPEHIREWWTDDADLDAAPGGVGTITFGAADAADRAVVPITVLEADPPHRFSFRWGHDSAPAADGNSLLVTFDLTPSVGGTVLKFKETGFRERGWAAAQVEETYRDHERGWGEFLPRLVTYAETVVVGA